MRDGCPERLLFERSLGRICASLTRAPAWSIPPIRIFRHLRVKECAKNPPHLWMFDSIKQKRTKKETLFFVQVGFLVEEPSAISQSTRCTPLWGSPALRFVLDRSSCWMYKCGPQAPEMSFTEAASMEAQLKIAWHANDDEHQACVGAAMQCSLKCAEMILTISRKKTSRRKKSSNTAYHWVILAPRMTWSGRQRYQHSAWAFRCRTYGMREQSYNCCHPAFMAASSITRPYISFLWCEKWWNMKVCWWCFMGLSFC